MNNSKFQEPLGTPNHLMEIEKINPWGSVQSRTVSNASQTSSQIAGKTSEIYQIKLWNYASIP